MGNMSKFVRKFMGSSMYVPQCNASVQSWLGRPSTGLKSIAKQRQFLTAIRSGHSGQMSMGIYNSHTQGILFRKTGVLTFIEMTIPNAAVQPKRSLYFGGNKKQSGQSGGVEFLEKCMSMVNRIATIFIRCSFAYLMFKMLKAKVCKEQLGAINMLQGLKEKGALTEEQCEKAKEQVLKDL